ncbi:MAG: PAC2 family protein [Acidimicrobiia bacterium]
MPSVRWENRPELRDPVLVAAFGGWNDAADAATDAVSWLARRFDAESFAALDPASYYDFQAARPEVRLRDGVMESLTWPTTGFAAAHVDGACHDLVLATGPEPNLVWSDFCDAVLAVAHDTGSTTVITLGALLAEAPHTRPVRLTGAAHDAGLSARLRLHTSHYEGPTGVTGALHHAATEAGFAAASVWAPVPHYVASPPNPPCTVALLDAVDAAVDLHLDTGDLATEADGWRRRVEVATSSDSEIESYIRTLEEGYDAEASVTGTAGSEASDVDIPSGDALAAEFQRYLRGERD